MVHTMVAGIRALLSSAKKATPEGRDRTPAPMTLFARLKVDAAIVDVPLETTFSFGVSLATNDAVDFNAVIDAGVDVTM